MLSIKFDRHWERKMMREEKLSEEELSVKENSFEECVLELMRALATNHYSEVTFHPYRTARVFDESFDADRESMRPLEYMLAIKAGVNPDNHTVYEVYDGCRTFYIWCHDSLFRVGKTIDNGRGEFEHSNKSILFPVSLR